MLSPASASSDAEQLLGELRALDTAELLALCLRFRRSPDRLKLYLTIFRSRSGVRAQFAASLVCFDLARLGSPVAEREFAALGPTMRELAEDAGLVAGLLAGDPYLLRLWTECRAALEAGDARELAAPPPPEEQDELRELPILEGEELDIPALEVNPEEAQDLDRRRFAALLEEHLGHDYQHGRFRWGFGFRAGTGAEIDRLEQFAATAASHGFGVPVARGLACLARLFLATHLRRRSLFGRKNQRRLRLLRSGLSGLALDLEAAAQAAALFEFEGRAVRERFQKVTELVLDYLAFCETDLDPRSSVAVDLYLAADRVPPSLSRPARRERRRR